jgi:hypothetical protein
MAELKCTPVPHDRKAFLAKARTRKGFSRAYDALALEYQARGKCSRLALAPASPRRSRRAHGHDQERNLPP